MPAVLRRSGPDISLPDGTTRTPRAIVAWCDECNAENAAFSEIEGGKRVYRCGWSKSEMKPICMANIEGNKS